MRAKLMALEAEASGSAQRVLRFAFLAAKLSIDTGELTDKGAVSQRNILRRHAALIEKLYADRPENHVMLPRSSIRRKGLTSRYKLTPATSPIASTSNSRKSSHAHEIAKSA